MNSSLQKELLHLYEEDFKLREQGVHSNFAPEVLQQIYLLDCRNAQRLKEIVQSVGWPGYLLVGENGSHAMWLLVQHTPDMIFQKYCLELLQNAAKKGDASSVDMAYLTDRVLTNEGKKQIYGTQWQNILSQRALYPVEDFEHLDERRQAVGLNSLEESINQLVRDYNLKREDFIQPPPQDLSK